MIEENFLCIFLDAADRDADGFVTHDELMSHGDLQHHEAHALMKKFDKDGDGQLDEAEYDKLKSHIIAQYAVDPETGSV